MESKKYRLFFVKRIVDFLLSLVIMLLIWPFILLIAICIRTFIGSPVLFMQTRPGHKGKPFKLYKFRTMMESRNAQGRLLPDEDRLTGLGKFLRSFSLDELPEIINVIKGDMSIIGPRPLLMQYLDRYSPEQSRRHDVLPGITGWAQVNGRNTLSWEDKFQLDVWYVDNWSIGLDIKIAFMTIWKVLSREGINEQGFATSREFMGNDE
ncbi:sugar transferase [Chloroflexota bacterium]